MPENDVERKIVRHVSELDVFMLTMDEPNAEKHWSLLLDRCPWAERIANVKGFDSAHRAAAEKSSTDWFVTVDADNVVLPGFFDLTVQLDHAKQCLSYNGMNMINGLQYGNGGLKIWSRRFVEEMRTHENADDASRSVDFCWERDYRQVQATHSEVWSNGSPYQAFRAGFREGVKLSLDRGRRVYANHMRTALHPYNLRNLKVWCCVGADQENGLWAMYGARAGWLK